MGSGPLARLYLPDQGLFTGRRTCASASALYKAPMPSPEINIHHIAKLSRLALSEAEATQYQQQLNLILGHIDQLSSYPLEAEPSAHALPIFDVIRADISRSDFTQEQALSNAPRRALDQFQIPKVIE